MQKRDLRAFMRDTVKTAEIITAPGPATILGDDGKPVMLEIKVLSGAEVDDINDKYRRRSIVTDKKGKPYANGSDVLYKTEFDANRATGHIMAEALVYPNLKDPELMEFFDCHDIALMAGKVFPRTDEFTHVVRAVLTALGLNREPDNDDTEVDDIKN